MRSSVWGIPPHNQMERMGSPPPSPCLTPLEVQPVLVCAGRRMKSVKGQHLGEIYRTVGGMRREAHPQPPLVPVSCSTWRLQTLLHTDKLHVCWVAESS